MVAAVISQRGWSDAADTTWIMMGYGVQGQAFLPTIQQVVD
jgi:hypothetical protein